MERAPFSSLEKGVGERIPSQLMRLCILSSGVQISKNVHEMFSKNIKEPLRTRAGAAGGLDMILEDGSWVNAPTSEIFAQNSPYLLDVSGNSFLIRANNDLLQCVNFPKRPVYYDKLTADGVPMSKVGVMLGDRLAISITNSCNFWNTPDVCKYCSIGLNSNQDLTYKKIDQVVETVVAAVSEGSANHVAINAGGLGGADRGAKIYAKYSRAIRNRIDVHIAAQLLPPSDLQYVNILKEEGYTEATYDMEIFSWDINGQTSPGKAKIGLNQYLRTLERAVKVFGDGNVTSNLIVGLESPESTARGVDTLTRMGVIPKLIVFRPLTGTPLESQRPPSVRHMIETYNLSIEAAKKNKGILGPLCVGCNINRLPVNNEIKFDELYATHGKYLDEIESTANK